MKEENVRLALHHALQWRGWAPYHPTDARKCPHCYRLIIPPTAGRADTTARHYTLAIPDVHIEVKDCKGQSFPFSEISGDQRKFLEKKDEHAWICIGKIVPMGSKETIDSIYVIPWKEWWRMENDMILLKDSNSIPYDYKLYEKKPSIQAPDLVSRFPKYALEYRDGDWHFRDDHPLAVQAEIEVPYHKRAKQNEKKEVVPNIN